MSDQVGNPEDRLSHKKARMFQAGLQQRLSEQETLVSELKSNLLHKDFQQQNFDSEKVCAVVSLNPLVTNGPSHCYQLDESTFIYRGIRSDFFFVISFFDENRISKQNSPRWDAAFCGVPSGAILFAYVS